MRKALTYTILALLLAFVAPVIVHAAVWYAEDRPQHWRSADWSSAGILPRPADEPDASIRVMAARTGGLKGVISVHSWLVLKRRGAAAYDRYEVVGWGRPLQHNRQPPDGRWFSNAPVAVFTLKGEEAERLIPKLEAAIHAYRFTERGSYRLWPGPNSNTFVATVLAAVPELNASLPPTAIGRDYRASAWLYRTPAGGWSLSLGGVAALTLGLRDGVALSLGGLVAGVRFEDFAILLPGFGALGEPI